MWRIRRSSPTTSTPTSCSPALNGYYDKLVKWVTDTVIPQAQVAIVAVTGGTWSVVIFLKNILIGMMISVYLLARKESFAKQSKKILYASARNAVPPHAARRGRG